MEAPDAVLSLLATDALGGLTRAEAGRRMSRYGANAIIAERPPSSWVVALRQLKDPMNLMLVGVAAVSLFLIDQVPVGVVVALLVVLNLVLGVRQELKARASVDALSRMQIPQARVVRAGTLVQPDATELVPGDIVNLEAGDLVPADGRLLRSATLETQEAALTGESIPIAEDPQALEAADVALGDRTNMVFQNTAVTRGTATMVVTGTGMQTEIGKIASMLSAVESGKSPPPRELDGLTKAVSWPGRRWRSSLSSGWPADSRCTVLLLGLSMAISAIPTHADVCADDAGLRRQTAGRSQSGGQEPQRRRNARGDERDQLRQDRHAHDETK